MGLKTNPTPIQLTFPLAEVAELAQASLGDLLRSVGKTFIEMVLEAEVEQLAGKLGAESGARRLPVGKRGWLLRD